MFEEVIYRPLPVPGYTTQPDAKIRLVTGMKHLEEFVLRSLDGLAQIPEVDKRWLAIGRTHLEQSFMAINRSIIRPVRVALPPDMTDQPAPATSEPSKAGEQSTPEMSKLS